MKPIKEDYKFLEVLGHGHYGVVRKAKKKRTKSEILFAIKSVVKDYVEKHLESLKNELDIMCELDHPNMIKLFEVYEDAKYLHLVMELCTGPCLLTSMKYSGVDRYTEKQAAETAKNIIAAVKYLHDLNICHRDLKPQNFIYKSDD